MNAKKKILSISLAVSVFAVAAIGSLAYFTDKDNAENTFAVGGVDIELIEQQRNDDNTALESFEQNKELYPIVGSAQGDKDEFGQPIAKNYVDKMVTVQNTGRSAAYVRSYFAIPSALDDGEETFNASMNVLHFNFGNDNGDTTYQNQWNWKNTDGSWKYFETEIGGIDYNVYYADYYRALEPKETTEQFVSGVYLDKSVDFDEDGNMWAFGQKLDVQPTYTNGTIACPVFSVAAQAAGFDNADSAITAAFGANFNPWAEPIQ